MSGASPFEILPAIDLRGGQVVRLRQGDFAQETAYGADPAVVTRRFAEAGARWIHVVDLDGARSGRPMHGEAVRAIAMAVGEVTRIEVAGGLRTAADVSMAFASGASRAVLGTVALADPAVVAALVAVHGPERIAVAIDVRGGQAVGHGWAKGAASMDAATAIIALADAGVTTFEVTSIARDGLLEGPDLGLYDRLIRLRRGGIVASGGVASLDDLRRLRELGCAGAILGRALYEGRLDLAAAVGALDAPR